MELVGSSFGAVSFSIAARVGASAARSTSWASDTAVECHTTAGVASTKRLLITVGAQAAGTLSEAYSYDVPSMKLVFFNTPTVASGNALIIRGKNFGTVDSSVAVSTGGSSCGLSNWLSDTSVRCRALAGIGSTKDLSVTIAVKVGTITEAISYDVASNKKFIAPAIGQPGVYENQGGNAPATGASSVTLSGEDFGTFETTTQMRPGGTGAEITPWASDSAVTAKVAAGVSFELGVTLTVALRENTLSQAFTYDAVGVVDPLKGSGASGPNSNGPMVGALTITVIGSNLAHNDYTGAVRVGHTACQGSEWVSESAIMCKESTGLLNSLAIILSLAVQHSSLSVSFTYNHPEIKASTATNLPNQPAEPVTIFGANFATHQTSARARLGGTSTQATMWFSDSSTRCQASFGIAGSHQIVFTTARASIGTLTDPVSYDAPSIHSLIRVNGPTLGGTRVSVAGFSFGRFDASPRLRVSGGPAHGHVGGGTGCEATAWTSESAVVCTTPRG